MEESKEDGAQQPADGAPQEAAQEETLQQPQEMPAQEEGAQPSPCVRTRVAIDAALLKRISKTSRPVILFMMILGIVMLVLYIVFSVIAEDKTGV